MKNKNQTKTKFKLSTLITLILLSLVFIEIKNIDAASAPQELRQAIDEKSKELEQINNQMKATQKILDDTQNQGKTLQKEIGQIDRNINQVNLGIKSSETMIEKLSLEINSLQYDIKEAEDEISTKQKAITKTFQEIQKKNNESALTIFLRNESLTASIFEIQGLSDLNKQLQTEVDNLQSSKIKLSNTLKSESDKKFEKSIENKNLKNQKSILADVKDERNTILKQTKQQEKIYQEIISTLEKKQMEIAADIDKMETELRESFNENVLPTKRAGLLGRPTAQYYVTQQYGATAFARTAYKSGFHNGLDLRAPLGTPILAAEDGIIYTAGDNGRVQYGKYVVIKHANGLATLYAHLSKTIVKSGNAVKRGEVIGYAGNTGYSFGSHLHFGAYWASTISLKQIAGAGLVPIGVTVNPADYF